MLRSLGLRVPVKLWTFNGVSSTLDPLRVCVPLNVGSVPWYDSRGVKLYAIFVAFLALIRPSPGFKCLYALGLDRFSLGVRILVKESMFLVYKSWHLGFSSVPGAKVWLACLVLYDSYAISSVSAADSGGV